MKHGFVLLTRNYLRPWGEIDLIVQKGNKVHFIEVKTSVSYETKGDKGKQSISHETMRPEDNIHPAKLKRIHKAVQTYCLEHGIEEEGIAIDAIIVRLSADYRKAKVTFIDNVL